MTADTPPMPNPNARRIAMALGALVAAVAVLWPRPRPSEPAPAAPAPIAVLPPSAAPTPRPTAPPSAPPVLHETLRLSGTAKPGLPQRTLITPPLAEGRGALGWLDARSGGPATFEWLGIDLNATVRSASGISPWSDFLMVRSALQQARLQALRDRDDGALDEALDLLDDARQRWPGDFGFDALELWAAPPVDADAIALARELLDASRRGEPMSPTTLWFAREVLVHADRSSPRFADDHRRLHWAMETLPHFRQQQVMDGLYLAALTDQPDEARRWFETWASLPDASRSPERVAEARQALVTRGWLEPTTWREQVAAQVGRCLSQHPPRIRQQVVSTGELRDGARVWLGIEGDEQSMALTGCLTRNPLPDGPDLTLTVRIDVDPRWPLTFGAPR